MVPSTDPATHPMTEPTDGEVTEAVLRWSEMLGLDVEALADRLGLTPACGLAGASPAWAKRSLTLLRDAAGHLSG